MCYKPPAKSRIPKPPGRANINLRPAARKAIPTLKSAAQRHSVFPTPAYTHQERTFASAYEVLRAGIGEQAFPGCAVAVVHQGKLVARKGLGRFTYEPDSAEVAAETIFDLASVSKVVATTSTAMVLYQRGELDLEAPVAAVVPEFAPAKADGRRKQVTFRMLLAHSSGLPAYGKLFQKAHHGPQLLHALFSTPLASDPGTRAHYSDLGFILLGEALARIAGEGLDRFCQREIFGPLGMSRTTFRPPAQWEAKIPPTVNDRDFRKRVIQGEVQDENAAVLGGVAGHAGVFATAPDLAVFAHALLNDGRPILRPATVALFTRRESTPVGSCRALGWDTPSPPSQSGKYFSPRSFGHLGYTGTSLWIDPERALAIALLSNRTWPYCSSEKIKQVRPRFHDAVVEALA